MRYMMTERERLEESLKGWALDMRTMASARDRLVSHALELGISKQRIHELSGVARTTINRIERSEGDRS